MKETKEVKLFNYSEKNGIKYTSTPVNDQIAEYELFGWKPEIQEETREMNGLKDFTNYLKVTFVRELEKDLVESLRKLEKEYFESKEKIISLREELSKLEKESSQIIEPKWKVEHTSDLGNVNGSRMYYTKVEYYGGYTPVNGLMIFLLFTPLLPVSLIYLIIKGNKKSKCKKQLKTALAEYNEKISKISNQRNKINEQIRSLEKRLNEIILEVNKLK